MEYTACVCYAVFALNLPPHLADRNQKRLPPIINNCSKFSVRQRTEPCWCQGDDDFPTHMTSFLLRIRHREVRLRRIVDAYVRMR
jgi:hypothetical protein